MPLVVFVHLHKYAHYASGNTPGFCRVKDLARQTTLARDGGKVGESRVSAGEPAPCGRHRTRPLRLFVPSW